MSNEALTSRCSFVLLELLTSLVIFLSTPHPLSDRVPLLLCIFNPPKPFAYLGFAQPELWIWKVDSTAFSVDPKVLLYTTMKGSIHK